MSMKWLWGLLWAFPLVAAGQDMVIESFDGNGTLTFTQAPDATSYRIEWASNLTGPWTSSWESLSAIAKTSEGIVTCSVPMFYRVVMMTNLLDYLVVDLSAGPAASNYPVGTLGAIPPGGWTDEYKTMKMVFRRIPAGTFYMGSPTNELGRFDSEVLHQVSISQPCYIGVFEVTQKQWERVMGSWPSYFTNVAHRDTRPVERVSYNMIRGNALGTNWPANSSVDADSFMGRLRARTGKAFDLPTESQWEYAGRAGTLTALNSGYNLTNTVSDSRLSQVGRYSYNGGAGYSQNGDTSVGSAKVGSYLPNAWGIYDIHGNVFEWCLDWLGTYPGTVTDPLGPPSSTTRIIRGGCWLADALICRAGLRSNASSVAAEFFNGFRVALPSGQW